MRFALLAACGVSAMGSMLSAAIVQYPAMDAAFSAPGSLLTNQTVGPVILDAAAGQYLDPDTGTPSAAATRYFGGVLSYTPNTDPLWGGGIDIVFAKNGGGEGVHFGKPAGRSFWYATGSSSSFDSAIAGSGEMPFVIKFADIPWNVTRVDFFLGSDAQTATEGTPNGSVTVNNLTGSAFLNDVKVTFLAEGWASGASAGSLQSFYSGTEWAPAVVPEPTSLGLIAAAGALALRRSRRPL